MAGQGTVGLEILEDVPQVTDVVISVGGGGFAAGVATAIKSLKPAVRIWGVETEGADCMSKSLAEGRDRDPGCDHLDRANAGRARSQ